MFRYNTEVNKEMRLSFSSTQFSFISINLYKKLLYSFSIYRAVNMASRELTIQFILLHKLNFCNINMERYFETWLRLNFSQTT